jgi:hypothetical protein
MASLCSRALNHACSWAPRACRVQDQLSPSLLHYSAIILKQAGSTGLVVLSLQCKHGLRHTAAHGMFHLLLYRYGINVCTGGHRNHQASIEGHACTAVQQERHTWGHHTCQAPTAAHLAAGCSASSVKGSLRRGSLARAEGSGASSDVTKSCVSGSSLLRAWHKIALPHYQACRCWGLSTTHAQRMLLASPTSGNAMYAQS